MENAARALLMAGGILFAIIVISVFMLGYSGMTQIQQEKEYQEAVQEVYTFNKSYLSFNKKAMYGSDVISVMNRAINNNKIYDADTPADEYYVDIIFSLHPDNGFVGNSEYTFVLNEMTGTYTSSKTNSTNTGYGASNMTFEAGHTYSLSSLWDPENGADPITGFLLTAGQNEETKTILEKRAGSVTKYKIEYSGIAGFKRRAFKCSRVEYDGTGKVSAMYFDELKVSTYGG